MTEQADTVFGIDLGTTYSCISYVDESGRPVVVPNAEGAHTTPSVIFFDGNTRVVGIEAKNNAVLHADEVVSEVKQQMGASDWRFPYGEASYSAEEISSYILRKVTQDAETYLNRPVKDVVITHPAYFGVSEREATKKAGELAGLNVLSLINEPTAAAVAYGFTQGSDQVVLVYDLGGGTFDITMIEIKGNAFTVIATGGNHRLGGRLWDAEVVKYLASEWMAATGSLDDPLGTPETLQDLYLRAEQGKISLSGRESIEIAVSHQGQRVGVRLTREKFNELTDGLLEQTMVDTRLVLGQARDKGFAHFDEILLVGGSTKMPQVKERIVREYNVEPKVFEPDFAVAKGATLYGQKLALGKAVMDIADQLTQQQSNGTFGHIAPEIVEEAQRRVADTWGLPQATVATMLDVTIKTVTTRSFGVLALKPDRKTRAVFNMIRLNDTLPARCQQKFHTVEANQQSVLLDIYEDLITDEEQRNRVNGRRVRSIRATASRTRRTAARSRAYARSCSMTPAVNSMPTPHALHVQPATTSCSGSSRNNSSSRPYADTYLRPRWQIS